MSGDVGRDQLALIRVEGMHCHKCERAIQKSLTPMPGVHEVEVDFNSGQVSVLYDPNEASISQFMEAVNGAGYRATGFSQRSADAATH
jgi:copper chaperone CopZ